MDGVNANCYALSVQAALGLGVGADIGICIPTDKPWLAWPRIALRGSVGSLGVQATVYKDHISDPGSEGNPYDYFVNSIIRRFSGDYCYIRFSDRSYVRLFDYDPYVLARGIRGPDVMRLGDGSWEYRLGPYNNYYGIMYNKWDMCRQYDIQHLFDIGAFVYKGTQALQYGLTTLVRKALGSSHNRK